MEVNGRLRAFIKGHGRGALLFGLVGFMNAATDFAVFSAGVWLGVSPVLANAVSFFCANVQSYRLNAAVTFRRNGESAVVTLRGYVKFAAAHLFGLAISTGFIIALSDMMGPIAAKASAVAFSASSNYVLSALFVFRHGQRTAAVAKSIDS